MSKVQKLLILLFVLFSPFFPNLTKPLYAFTTTVRFLYDGDGVRVGKIEEGKTTLYVGDMEKNITTGEVTKYYAIGGKRVAVKEGVTFSFIVSDHLGSLRNLSDLSGTKKANLSYYPYGQIRSQVGTVPSRQYTGQINDETTGLYFYNARYYNPQNGVFTQADTNNKSLNKYFYATGNPVGFIDPSGNEEEPSLQLPVILKNDNDRYFCELPQDCLGDILGLIWQYLEESHEIRQSQWAEIARIENSRDSFASHKEWLWALSEAWNPIIMEDVMGITGGVKLADALESYIAKGVYMIKTGRPQAAISHFENTEAAKAFGLRLDLSRAVIFRSSPSEKEVAEAIGEIGLASMSEGTTIRLGRLARLPNKSGALPPLPESLSQEVAVIHAEEWLHTLQSISGKPIWGHPDPEVDITLYLRGQNIPLSGSFWRRHDRFPHNRF